MEALYPTSKTVEKAAEGVHGAIETLAAKAAPTVGKIADVAKTSLADGAEKIVSVQADLVDGVRTYVRDRPFTAVALAVLLGALAVSGILRTKASE